MNPYLSRIYRTFILMLGPRTDAPRTKVGTDESKSSLKNLGKAYSRLSDAALADLKAEAAKMNASRENF